MGSNLCRKNNNCRRRRGECDIFGTLRDVEDFLCVLNKAIKCKKISSCIRQLGR